ncbi:Rap30/74 interaction domain-containing protein [Yamadazyma tenuis ATCC 10573]|uniref:Transcription initiation factor IIF subunit alpha n=1 Tax=Candida tenuis (strain ATCC 10573 / BCRC 21748 / CBS 615 / JCM 9827 / NBRC 10315 / NRRL Y-1498 / VKM Y-70) TaxID=590646 RepID=G3B6C5_CANTC|nr:Rap30/74 interaction domain-containing protein [Yamadazyma tenuis ATCC 10573]EGV63434.1 Rap30/74 interaction domain-containing protein [Yamadazyma tenuis ATCC 10573]
MSTPQPRDQVTVKQESPASASVPVSLGSSSSSSSPNGKNPDQGWQDIPLKCYSEEDIKDKRHHIVRFTNKNNVDILKDFTKPVRLHRKDPRNIQFHLSRQEIDQKKRREQQRAVEKAKRKQQRLDGIPVDDTNSSSSGTPSNKNQMDLSQVAPEGGARNFRRNIFKRKTRQINLMADEKRKLRYEEYYPWVMEDYDGQNVYVGNYEAGASEASHVLFVFDKDGFKMIPAEKVYRFNPRNKYATLTLEEAEAKMEKKSAVPRWLMKHMSEKEEKDYRFRNNGNASANQVHIRGSNSNGAGNKLRTVSGASQFNDRDSDHDDIDFDEEFADDEEAPIMDADEEENKMAEQKMKKEMLKASHFDAGSDAEPDDDLDELFETEKSRKIDKEGKKLRKVLNKTEGGVYDSDDDDQLNPYLSKSDLESDDESDDGIEVKQEPDENNLFSQPGHPKARSFFAYNVGDGFVVIKAPPKFLEAFPRGEWLPEGRKRPIKLVSESPQKRQKPNEPREKSLSPTPSVPAVDLNDAGPTGSLVTIQEVLDIVKGNPLPPKELLIKLRGRINANEDNKQRIIMIVKMNLKLEKGMLVLKE